MDVAVSGIEDVVFADMVFRAERENQMRLPSRQAVHAVAGVFDGRAVRRYLRAVAAGRSLGKNRRARLSKCCASWGVMTVRPDLPLTTFLVFSKPVPLC